MADIRLQTHAIKVVNKGGGWKGKTEIVEEEKEQPSSGEGGAVVMQKVKVQKKVYKEIRTSGSDYIVFNCPACGERNKRCAYDAIVESAPKDKPIVLPDMRKQMGPDKESVLAFRCHKCYRMIEVKKPINLTMPDDLLVKLK